MKNREALRQLTALLRRREGNAQEIIDLQFGGKPPPGLTVDPDLILSAPVRWKLKMDRKKKYDAWQNGPAYSEKGYRPNILSEGYLSSDPKELGDGFIDEAQKLFLNKKGRISAHGLPPSRAAANLGLIGHEAVHAQQRRAVNLDTILFPEKIAKNYGASAWNGHGPEMEKILVSEEEPSATKRRHRILKKSLQRTNVASPYYLFEWKEMQARLHEMIAYAAPSWERLPGTPRELKAALAETLGAKKLLSAQERRLAAHFPIHGLKKEKNVIVSDGVRDLKFVVARLSGRQRHAFFSKALPEMYGSLLEFYGDPDGRKKMGFKPNAVYARAIANQILTTHYNPKLPRWSEAQWEKMVKKAEPQAMERLLSLSLVNHDLPAFDRILKEMDARAAGAPALTAIQQERLLAAALNHHAGAHGKPQEPIFEAMIERLVAHGALPARIPVPGALPPFSRPQGDSARFATVSFSRSEPGKEIFQGREVSLPGRN